MFKSAITRAIYLTSMFLGNFLLANLLLPLHFGTLTIMILNASVFSILTGLGTDSIILHSLVNKKWRIGQALTYTRNAVLIQVLLFILFELLSISSTNKTFLSRDEITYLIPEGAFFIGLILTDKLLMLFYSINKALVANRLLFVTAVIFLTILIFFHHYKITDPEKLILLFSMQSLFQGLMLFLFFYLHYKQPFESITFATVVGALKLSLIVMLTNVIQFFAYRVDYYFIKKFYTGFEVGVFAQSNKLANLMWIIPNIFSLLLIPKLDNLSLDQYKVIIQLAFLKNIMLALFTLFAGYFAFVFVLDPEYTKGLYAFYFMVPGYLCWATVIYFGAYFSYIGKFHYNLIASSFCFIAILISDISLIPSFGINGAAISNTIAYSLSLYFYLFLFNRSAGIKLMSRGIIKRADFFDLIKRLK